MAEYDNYAASAAAAANQAASAINGFAQTIANSKTQDKVLEAQKELTHEQWAYEKQMWNENNNYNSPENQLKLYREAGLNPAMFISGLTATSGSPAAATSVSPAIAPLDNTYVNTAANMINAYSAATQRMQAETAASQLELNKQKNVAEIAKMAAETSSIEIDNDLKKYLNPKQIEQLELINQKTAKEIASITSDIKFKEAQTLYTEGKLKTENVLRQARLDEITANIFKTKADTKLTYEQCREINQKIALLVLDEQIKSQEIALNGVKFDITVLEQGGLRLQLKQLQREDEAAEGDEATFIREHPLIIKTGEALLGVGSKVASAFLIGKFAK